MRLKRFHGQNCLSPRNVMIASDYIRIAHANFLTCSSVWNPLFAECYGSVQPGVT